MNIITLVFTMALLLVGSQAMGQNLGKSCKILA